MKRIVVISDTQIPYHDERAVNNVISFIHAWKPDEVVHIGDLMDYPQPSSWNKDTRLEFEGSIHEDSKLGKAFVKEIRDGHEGPFKLLRSNHDDRPRIYQSKYAPALTGDDAYNIETLLDLDNFGVEVVGPDYEFADKWIMTHGHLTGASLSQLGGRSALLAAEGAQVNVIMGHTHRLGLMGKTYGRHGDLHTLWGMEVGNLMNVKGADYIMRKGGRANWQQGFGIVYQDGDTVTPVPIPVHKDGTFFVDGYTFGTKAA